MVFVESMLARVPVVATKLGGAQEILGQGGGRLVEAEVGPVAATLRELISDRRLREAIGREGWELARVRYAPQNGVTELTNALARLLKDVEQQRGGGVWA